ncbi:MAG: ABC transporter ATP-binding protein [Bacteroidales bacterium]|nr:ABC transporter ATP-binding protein [Bacteroidales bacterium]MCF8397649.1 ABC transporter ATP-binding protein [Bacteroidales bacterium]
MSEDLITIQDLSVNFNTEGEKVKAVDHIDFNIKRGQILGIVGESGSGKSVTALSILKLIQDPGKIASGKILYYKKGYNAVDLLKLPENEMQHYRGNEISMIFQEPMTSLNPVYKCGKQVAEPILTHKKKSKSAAKKRSIELFRELKLPRPEKIWDQYPHELSGGQKQRVMIAMAMACEPALLIADEPTTALDVTVQKSILENLQELSSRHGMSILFITHDLGVIAELADEVLIMYKGKIVEQGATHKVFHGPEHPYTKGLLACRPEMDTHTRRLPTVADFMNANTPAQNTSYPQKQSKKDFSSADDLVRTKNLSKVFKLKSGLFQKAEFIRAIDRINLAVKRGETLGLVGESGCGKTTLGRTILRLIDATEGDVFFREFNLTHLKSGELRKLRKKIQIIFQDPYSSLNPRISIGSAIKEPMKVFGLHASDKARKQKALDLLERVGLEKGHYNRYPHEFSGGQRQRISIARALAVEPEFIVCDESVSALDVSVQAQILNLLNDLKDEFGFSYIFISHDLSVVKYMSDRIAVMKDGKILETGQADEIYKKPETKYTKELIKSIPMANPTLNK